MRRGGLARSRASGWRATLVLATGFVTAGAATSAPETHAPLAAGPSRAEAAAPVERNGPASAAPAVEGLGPAAPVVRRAVAEDLLARARALGTRYPGRLEVHPYGVSRAGRPLVALRVRASRPAPDGAATPALLLTPEDFGAGPEGPEELLQRAEELLFLRARRGAADPLGEVDWWVLPDLDPDRLAADSDADVDPGAERRRLERLRVDLPTDWDPWLDRAGARPGPWPLHEPETRALEAWLREHPELMGWVRTGADAAPDGAPGGEVGATSAPGLPGSLERHLVRGLGLRVLRAPGGGPGPLERALDELPRWHREGRRLTALGDGLWQVRLELRRSGRGPAGRALLRVEGAELLHATDGAGRGLDPAGAGGSGRALAPEFGGGDAGEVLLVLRGESLEPVVLEVREPHAFGCREAVVLAEPPAVAGR